MTRVVLIRHGRSTANAQGVLAGRAPGIRLDEHGRDQASRLQSLFDAVPVAAAYTSPIERCRETALLAGFPDAEILEDLTECDYGLWTGRSLDELRDEAVWEEIQAAPASVTFPGGESMQEMFARVGAVMSSLVNRHAAADTVAVFSHGDPIKAALSHALGIRLDDFQRVHVNPGSVSVVDFQAGHPIVLCINAGPELVDLLGARPTGSVVGGGDVAGAH